MFILWKETLIALGIFLIYAWQDIKTRSVSIAFLILGALTGAVLSALGQRQLPDLLPALLPGALLICLSYLTKGALGLGDGIAVAILGLFLPLGSVLSVTALAFILASGAALSLTVIKRFDRKICLKKGLPFLAFVPPGLLLLYCRGLQLF